VHGCPSCRPSLATVSFPCQSGECCLCGGVKVQVAVVTKTVTVTHVPAEVTAAALACALDGAGLNASLTAPRQHVRMRQDFVPPPQGRVKCLCVFICFVIWTAQMCSKSPHTLLISLDLASFWCLDKSAVI
jgi:hypothetical protein